MNQCCLQHTDKISRWLKPSKVNTNTWVTIIVSALYLQRKAAEGYFRKPKWPR